MMTQNRAGNRGIGNKPDRVPVSGIRDILTVMGTDPNFAYRFVVDEDEQGSRIMRFTRGGWEFARQDQGTLTVGNEFVYKSKSDGSLIRLHTGDGKYSYLMRIKKEWYNEDQKAKQDDINEVENTITATGTSTGEDFGQYGKIKIGQD